MRVNYLDGYYEGDIDFFDNPHGYGAYFWHDGSRYMGNWKHGEFHGQGTFFYPDGVSIEGYWSDSEHCKNAILKEGSSRTRGEYREGNFYFD